VLAFFLFYYHTALENQSHYEAYQQALKVGVEIPIKCLKVLFFGPPRTGKTSMRRRLVGEILNLAKEPVQASTGTAECYDAIVKVVEDNTIASPAVITRSEWSSVKALFGKEKNTHETGLNDELRLLYQFVYEKGVVPTTDNRSLASSTNKPSSRPPEKEARNTATTEQSPASVKSDNVPGSESPKADPNASISLLDGKRTYLSDEQMKGIEKAFEAVDKVLHSPGKKQLKVLLEGTILMNMVDTGGQPAFLEMLPALTIGPALYLIFFKLDQGLKVRCSVLYGIKEKNITFDDSYTNEEVIFQALSSIACFSCTAPRKANMPNPSHAAMLIGTHKDQLRSKLGSNPKTVEAEIKDRDGALEACLKDTDLFKLNKNFLHYASNDQLMFAIDNMTGDEGELTAVRERLENVIKREFGDLPIPASWLMFSIFLRKMEKRTMSLLECHEIGKRLEANTDEALWFLHHHIGVLMYFPDIPEIKDMVICDPQVVFDSVTDLILNSFTFNTVDKIASEKFKRTGQFSLRDIEKIARNSKSDNLPLPKLVKLLEHLNIIAPSSNPQSDAYQKEEQLYFMPAVLKHATEEELSMKQSLTDPDPLMIHFKCGFVPVGVFCAMVANLVAREDNLGWILQEPRDGYNLCKNKVTFRINGAYNITLISKPKWYEVHITRISTTHRALGEICKHVLETLCDTVDQVISKMKYKQNLISSRFDQTLYELGFKCPKHQGDDHLVINRPESREGAPSQSAKSLWFYYLQKKSVMICLKTKISVDLKDTPFAQQSLVWFGEASQSCLVGQFHLVDLSIYLTHVCRLQKFLKLQYPVRTPPMVCSY